jgi:hypothetical protein
MNLHSQSGVLSVCYIKTSHGEGAMPVPDYQTLMRPLLAYAADGKEAALDRGISLMARSYTETTLSQL